MAADKTTMDEKAIKLMIAELKNDMIAQMKQSEEAIKESVRIDIKETEKNLRNDIEEVKSDVAANRTDIEQLKARVIAVEEKQKTGKNVIDHATRESEPTDEISKIMSAARCRVGIKPITLEDINEVASKACLSGMAALRESVREFLMDELKLDDEELDNLGDYEVYRKDVDENDKVYLKFTCEESSNYITRKAALVRNENVHVFPYIPPQLYQRFADLSRYTFNARHADKRLKTKIILGKRDLVLKTKIKDTTDWVVQEDLNVFGEVADIDFNVLWPVSDVKSITSPPKGRKRKKVHDVSLNSESGSPEPKRTKDVQSPKEKEDIENKRKVAEFVRNLEKKSGGKKYTQTKIKLTSSKDSSW